MNCTEYREHASSFIDGELETQRQIDLFKHLAQCAECQSFIDVLLQAREVRRMEHILFPADLDDTILSKLTAARTAATSGKAKFWKRRIAFPVPVAAAFTLVLIGLLAALFFNRTIERQALPVSSQQALGQPTAVIVVYTVPPVEVHGSRLMESIRNTGQIQN